MLIIWKEQPHKVINQAVSNIFPPNPVTAAKYKRSRCKPGFRYQHVGHRQEMENAGQGEAKKPMAAMLIGT
jgi:hypothetical protein